jgi:hypothetical protein
MTLGNVLQDEPSRPVPQVPSHSVPPSRSSTPSSVGPASRIGPASRGGSPFSHVGPASRAGPVSSHVTSHTTPAVTFRLGLVVLHERSIRTTIGTVFIHISYFPPTLVASLRSYVMSCDVLVMCCVALFCVVPRPSDTSIVVLGFVTHSTVREELQSRLIMYISCVHEKENLRFDFLNHSTCPLQSDRLRRRRALRSSCPTS